MRIQLIATLLCLISFGLHAVTDVDDKRMQELFEKYDKIMNEQQTELVDEVFTKKFLKDNGGKEEFIAKVKELPPVKKKKGLKKLLQNWKKSKVGKIFFAKVKDENQDQPQKHPAESQFVILEEDGKLKIDGSVSDGE